MKSLFASAALCGRGIALVAVAAVAVATTAAAHASSFNISPTQQGQIGYTGNVCTACDGASANIANTSTGGTLGYNFLYDSAASSLSPGAGGSAGNVAMDKATSADGNLTTGINGTGLGILALDADYQESAVDVTLSGLAANTTYQLTFDYAETQQLWSGETPLDSTGSCGNSNPGPYCDTNFMAAVTVGGGATASAANSASSAGCSASGAADKVNCGGADITAQTFSGWTGESFDFTTGSSGTEVLSFLASSTDANVPSFALLDDIQYAPVGGAPIPEPNSLLLMGSGLLGLGGLVRSRLAKRAAKV